MSKLNRLRSCIVALMSFLVFLPTAEADITVKTFLDINNDGIQNDGETLINGLSVSAFDQFGNEIPLLNDGAGTFTLPSALMVGRVRIQVTGYDGVMRQGVSGPTSVFFGEDGDEFIVPVSNGPSIEPGNSRIMIPCYDGGPAEGKTTPGLVSFPYESSGVAGIYGGDGPTPQVDATIGEIGSAWGVAYQTKKNRVFTTAVLKRHVGLGPEGVGGVYMLDYNEIAPEGDERAGRPAIKSMSLQGVTGADGKQIKLSTIRRQNVDGDVDETMPYALTTKELEATYDMDAFFAVGKTAFGDIDLTEDQDELWMVNLSERSLISMDVSGDELGTNIRSHSIMGMSGLPNLNFRYRMCINAGGNRNGSGAEAFTDRNGTAWDKNKYATGGTSAFNTGTFQNTDNQEMKTSGDMLYQTYRMGDFKYKVVAPEAETYKVVLHFAEPVSTYKPQDRLFDIFAEGQLIKSNFDIVASAGKARTATTYQFEVPVMDGELNLEFKSVQGQRIKQALVAGIEVIGQSIMKSGFLRPWGLGFKGDRGYLGMVADGSISKSREHVMGYVLSFDPKNINAGFTEELAFELGYPRERASNAHLSTPQPLRSGEWQAWIDDWKDAAVNTQGETLTNGSFSVGALLTSYPQPILSDIDFTANGEMVIGLMDRFGHQMGFRNYAPDLNDNTLITTYGAGDILKAVEDDGIMRLERKPIADLGPYRTDDGPSFAGEFFYDDHFVAQSANHGEIFTGGLGILPTSKEVVNTVFNPVRVSGNANFEFEGIYTQGLHTYNTETGKKERGYLMSRQYENGKANGLGDLEFFFELEGGEIGNYVWCDVNSNGVQDANEKGIAGVTVELINKSVPLPISTTQTDEDGEYVFRGIIPGACYTVRINLQQLIDRGYTGEASPLGGSPDDEIDSNGDPDMIPGFSTYMFCADELGSNRHDIDFGFIGPEAIPCTFKECPNDMGVATFEIDLIEECVDPNDNIVMIYSDSMSAHDMIDANKIESDIEAGSDSCVWARVMPEDDPMCGTIAKVTLLVDDPENQVPIIIDEVICPDEIDFDLASLFDDLEYTYQGYFNDAKGDQPMMGNPAIVEFPEVFVGVGQTEDGCPVCVIVNLDSIPNPILDAGSTESICFPDCVNLADLGATFDANGSGVTNVYWTTSGGGSFNSDSTYANARFYCPDSSDLEAGAVTLRLVAEMPEDQDCPMMTFDSVMVQIRDGVPRPLDIGRRDSVLCVDSFAINPTAENDRFPGCRLVVGCTQDTLSGEVIDYSILEVGECDTLIKKIKRTFEFHYEKQVYRCCDTICVLPLSDTVTCPPMSDSLYWSDDYKTDENGHPHPDVTGTPMADTVPLWPQPNGICKYLVNYTDHVFESACPVIIRRDWHIKNACAHLDTTCSQWLMIFDTIGPELEKDFTGFVVDKVGETDVVLIPASTHSCDAHAYIPPVKAEDDCAGVKTAKVIVPGVATVLMEFNPLTGLWESHEKVKLPKSDVPQPYIYHAFDSCHNITIDTCYFYVKDYVRPVAVCDKGLTVTVGDTTSWVYASSLDEGSWDNCGIGYTLIRRSDWATACGVNLCDDISYLCDTEHHDSIWCANLEMDKHVNPIEAHYAETLKWLCADGNDCAATLLSGWAYDLIKYATLDCIDHPYEVDENYLMGLLKECIIPTGKGYKPIAGDGVLASLLCAKLGEEFEPSQNALFKPAAGSKLSFLDIGKQIGGGWSKAVPFCCEDACTNVTLELLTMDYWCNWSKCWTDVWVEDNTPPTVVAELADVNITCATYKTYYADAVDQALAGDFDALQEKLGKYDKVTIDNHGNPSAGSTFRLYEVTCDSSLQEKDTLIYDEHLGYKWKTISYYKAEYDTTYQDIDNGAVADNCGLQYFEEEPWISIDHCGNGFIKRVFKFVGQCQIDGNEHKADTITRHQTIWIGSDCPITKSMFYVPEDAVVSTCGIQYDPSGSGNVVGAVDPSVTGEASYLFDNDCRLVGIGHYDKVFRVVGGDNACYKIVRTWCFADWCEMGVSDDVPINEAWWLDDKYVGRYLSCTQKIIVEDLSPPLCTIDAIGDGGIVEAAGCAYDLDVNVGVEDECGLLAYSWQVKLLKGSSSEVVASDDGELNAETTDGFNVSAMDLAPGEYKLVVLVRDDCQNEGQCEAAFEVKASKKPAPICITSLTAELTPMDTSGDGSIDIAMATVWAKEFNSSSEPACGGAIADIRIDDGEGPPALPAPGDTGLVVTCADVPQKLVRMYVLDENGNWDYCSVILLVQDNNNACGAAGSPRSSVAGSILTETSKAVEDVRVKAENAFGALLSEMASTNGSFELAWDASPTAKLQLEKSDIYRNGVSTADLIDIRKHILGKQQLPGWYRKQAADANSDGRISPLDLIHLRKLILGKTDELESAPSWRFYEAVTKQQAFDLALLPEGDKAHFIGVKVGDVNLDNDPTLKSSRAGNSMILLASDAGLQGGKATSVTFLPRSLDNIDGFQFTLEIDQTSASIQGVSVGEALDIKENLNTEHIGDGWLTISWNGDATAAADLALTIEILPLEDVSVSEVVTVSSKHTEAEAYRGDGKIMDVALGFESAVEEGGFELRQNRPNPFSDETTIAFRLAEADDVTLTVYDVTGKTLKAIEIQGAIGLNQVQFRRPDLTEGILYYKLQTDELSAVKKMILID